MNTYLTAKGIDVDRADRNPAPVDPSTSVSAAWASILGLSSTDGPISINDDTVRGLPALDRAVTLVSNSVASMATKAALEAPEAVIRRPHPLYGTFEFYKMTIETAMKRGNFIAVIVNSGPDAQLVPVHPDVVTLDQTSGFPLYKINGRAYTWREIFHVRANAAPGSFRGLGIIEKFRIPLSEQLHSQRWAEATYRTGGVPAGVVTIDQTGPVTIDQTDTINDSWQTKFGNSQRKVAVLPKGLSFTPVSWSPHDAEFAESRRIGVAEAALMAGLRPEDLGSTFGGGGMTYGNRTDDSIQRITDSYGSWTELLEQALTDLVGRTFDVDPTALLRLTPREAAEVEALELANEAARRQNTTSTEETTS